MRCPRSNLHNLLLLTISIIAVEYFSSIQDFIWCHITLSRYFTLCHQCFCVVLLKSPIFLTCCEVLKLLKFGRRQFLPSKVVFRGRAWGHGQRPGRHLAISVSGRRSGLGGRRGRSSGHFSAMMMAFVMKLMTKLTLLLRLLLTSKMTFHLHSSFMPLSEYSTFTK